RGQADEDAVSARLAEINENRAGIEQAKGMLMLVYGISEDAAFELLRWLSQEANIKLRPLAEQIVEDFRDAGLRLNAQTEFDHLLLTAHERVAQAEQS
ncbi:ANTAR domain-containing protein, partial [Mycobacterium malmoense]|uniref:ANTAR domain-containing protein n=1 Tax=Mycobacterium malmoense TaxID=1780 RepID=UPI000A676291